MWLRLHPFTRWKLKPPLIKLITIICLIESAVVSKEILVSNKLSYLPSNYYVEETRKKNDGGDGWSQQFHQQVQPHEDSTLWEKFKVFLGEVKATVKGERETVFVHLSLKENDPLDEYAVKDEEDDGKKGDDTGHYSSHNYHGGGGGGGEGGGEVSSEEDDIVGEEPDNDDEESEEDKIVGDEKLPPPKVYQVTAPGTHPDLFFPLVVQQSDSVSNNEEKKKQAPAKYKLTIIKKPKVPEGGKVPPFPTKRQTTHQISSN